MDADEKPHRLPHPVSDELTPAAYYHPEPQLDPAPKSDAERNVHPFPHTGPLHVAIYDAGGRLLGHGDATVLVHPGSIGLGPTYAIRFVHDHATSERGRGGVLPVRADPQPDADLDRIEDALRRGEAHAGAPVIDPFAHTVTVTHAHAHWHGDGEAHAHAHTHSGDDARRAHTDGHGDDAHRHDC